ncbi:MAG: YitT family protein [Waltera sp.]
MNKMKAQLHEWKEALKNITLKKCAITLLGSFILAFGLYHVHSISGVTEGGVLGATLLLEHWTGISPALTGGIMNVLCYVLGWKLLGKEFIAYSALATVGFSGMYKICEQFPHLWPGLADMPLVAALVGALFVGVGAGLCVRVGGAPSGDDALAMSISHATDWKIQWVYLLSDLIVLVMSLSYIPVRRIGYSLFTVLLSGQLIGFVQNFNRTQETGADCVTEN